MPVRRRRPTVTNVNRRSSGRCGSRDGDLCDPATWRSRTGTDLEAAAGRSIVEGDQMPDDIRWIRSYVLSETDGTVGTVCIYEASSPGGDPPPRTGGRPPGRRDHRRRRHRRRTARPGNRRDLGEGGTKMKRVLALFVAVVAAMCVTASAAVADPGNGVATAQFHRRVRAPSPARDSGSSRAERTRRCGIGRRATSLAS